MKDKKTLNKRVGKLEDKVNENEQKIILTL